jgi:thiosulfate dehydrogenase [quinone] large subunit
MAHQSLPTIRREARALGTLIGAIALVATLHAGYTFVDSAVSKWTDPPWTGHRAGAALSGFLTGTDQKAIPSDKNPHPDVLPATRDLNHAFIRDHPRLFSWLVSLGEICLPVAVLVLLCVRFRGSRPLALLCAGLAALLNMVYLLEGSSGLNPPMLILWLTVLWLLATPPAPRCTTRSTCTPLARNGRPTSDCGHWGRSRGSGSSTRLSWSWRSPAAGSCTPEGRSSP